MSLRTAILLLSVIWSLTLYAEEPTTSQQPETKTTPNSSKTDQTSKKNNLPTNKKSTAAEFDPSEEISEDLSVPFPVDI